MKLKKLLAAVTAAALAVTTMAVTSFTASATSLDEAPVGAETVLYSVDLSAIKSTFTGAWDSGDWTQVVIDDADRATLMTDPEVYIKATMSNMGSVTTDDGDVDFNTLMTWGFGGYSWMTGLKWYNNSDNVANFECNLIPLPTSTADRAIAYAPISDTVMYDWGGIAGNLQCGHFNGLTLNKLEIVRVSAVVDTTVYADQVLPLPEFEDSTLKFDGTFDKTKINGPGAYIEIKWTANDASSGMKLMKAEDYDTVIGQKNGNGSIGAQTSTFSLDETFIAKMTDKMWVNCWGAASIESVTIHNDAAMGNVYSEGGSSGHTHTGGTATCQNKAVCEICGEEYGSLAAHNYVDGVCSVCGEEESTTPVDPSGALWEGTQDLGNWVGAVEIAADRFASVNANNEIKFTYTINAVPGEPWNQIKILDGNETVLASPTGKNEWDCVDLSSLTTYSFEISAADLALVKANGMTIVGHGVVLTKVECVAAGGDHTHTPAAAWTSDATGHWHACSGCTVKVDFAAHTSDGGNITTPATETTAGVKTYKCTVCDYVIKTENIPAIGTEGNPWTPPSNIGAPVIPFGGVTNTGAPSVGGKSGWDVVSAEITAASDGDTIVVDMNNATKVPSTIFSDIEGKDVDIVLNMGRGIKWTINGLSVTGHKTIDFDVTKNTRHIPNEVVNKAEGSHKKQISLDHKGNFGCTASLTYDIGTKYNGLYANLFYYNPKTDELEFTDCSLISGGNAKFTFTHASDYLITISDEPLGEFEDVSSASGIVSDNNSIGNGIAVSAVLAAIVLGFGLVVYKKRRHN